MAGKMRQMARPPRLRHNEEVTRFLLLDPIVRNWQPDITFRRRFIWRALQEGAVFLN